MGELFERRCGCHDCDHFTVRYGNAAALEGKSFFDISTYLRAILVKMLAYAAPGSKGGYYIEFIWIYGWETYQHIFAALDDILFTWQPPPVIKLMSEKASGRRDAKDNAPGWSACVTEDSALFQATLVESPRRPKEGCAAADKKSKTEKDMIKKVKAWDLYLQGRA